MDPAPAPPNCTPADLAGVSAGVAAATSAYLFAYPDVNDYFTGLDANPQVHSDLVAIRQPLIDFRSRCRIGESGESD